MVQTDVKALFDPRREARVQENIYLEKWTKALFWGGGRFFFFFPPFFLFIPTMEDIEYFMPRTNYVPIKNW